VTWLTWRQHRQEAIWWLALTAAMTACIAFLTHEIAIGLGNCPGISRGYCLPDDAAGQAAQAVLQFNLAQYGLVVLPALAGAFVGAPLVARELESGTHRLVWTQGATRTRWILTKLVMVVVPLLAAAALLGWMEILYIDAQGANANRWALFDQQAPMTIASVLLALGLGVLFGAVIRRSIPAMAATLVTFTVLRIGIAELARPIFQPQLEVRTQSGQFIDTSGMPTAWWTDQSHFVDSTGRTVPDQVISSSVGTTPAEYFRSHGFWLVQHYQTGSRFWTFQAIESSILVGLGLVALAFAVYWVVRRAS
jgi:hypothetical protein